MQYFRLFRFLVSLSSLSVILFISGCVQSGNVFVAPNKVVLADQTPNTHFEQEVMITRIQAREERTAGETIVDKGDGGIQLVEFLASRNLI